VDVKKETTHWLCRDFGQQLARIENAAKLLAEAKEAAKAIQSEIELRMAKADVDCMVCPSGQVFVSVDLEDFAPSFVVMKSRTPWDVDRMLTPEPPAAPDDADGGPMPDRDPAVVAAVKGWAMAEGGAA
jgi:hypothetical protein